MTLEHLYGHLIRLIHAPIHVYDEAGSLTALYVDHGEQQNVLISDTEFCSTLLAKRSTAYPVLFLEAQRIIYGIAAREEETYILGPCCLDGNRLSAAKYLVQTHHLDDKRPFGISRTSLEIFSECLLMLYEELTGREAARDDLLMGSCCDGAFDFELQKKVHDVNFLLREDSAVHNPYSQELREQAAIRNGDLKALQESWRENYAGQVGTLAKDPLRQAKNISIALIILASRSAMEGGLLPEVAYSMSDAFIQQTEEFRDVGKSLAMGRQAEIEFCKAVHNLADARQQNSLIVRCKELIVQQLHSRITVQDLAAQLDISPGYLSRLFLQEEGKRLSDYIISKKLETAGHLLTYSEMSYQSISASLGFVSQSHFGQAFKKHTGMTPKQYRETRMVQRRGN